MLFRSRQRAGGTQCIATQALEAQREAAHAFVGHVDVVPQREAVEVIGRVQRQRDAACADAVGRKAVERRVGGAAIGDLIEGELLAAEGEERQRGARRDLRGADVRSMGVR